MCVNGMHIACCCSSYSINGNYQFTNSFLNSSHKIKVSNQRHNPSHQSNWDKQVQKMTSHRFTPSVDITSLVFLTMFIIIIPNTHSKNIGNSRRDATFEECEPSLLSLAPCESFMQATASQPTQSCCSNLKEFLETDQNLRCLCLLLSDPTLVTIPVNRTLALQLPTLCNLQADTSTCSVSKGLTGPIPRSPSSPASQETLQSRSNSTAAASPVVTVVPKSSSIMGFNSQNSGEKLDAESHKAMALLIAIVFIGSI